MAEEVILTAEGLRRLEEELNYLKGIRRQEVAERIKQAIEFGDISENSEYDEAKNEQAFIEGRILTLEKQLRRAKVIDPGERAVGEVGLGSRVRVKEVESGEEMELEIVGSMEADPAHARISNLSPVGKALLGQKPGAMVEVRVPAGLIKYQVLSVQE